MIPIVACVFDWDWIRLPWFHLLASALGPHRCSDPQAFCQIEAAPRIQTRGQSRPDLARSRLALRGRPYAPIGSVTLPQNHGNDVTLHTKRQRAAPTAKTTTAINNVSLNFMFMHGLEHKHHDQ